MRIFVLFTSSLYNFRSSRLQLTLLHKGLYTGPIIMIIHLGLVCLLYGFSSNCEGYFFKFCPCDRSLFFFSFQILSLIWQAPLLDPFVSPFYEPLTFFSTFFFLFGEISTPKTAHQNHESVQMIDYLKYSGIAKMRSSVEPNIPAKMEW